MNKFLVTPAFYRDKGFSSGDIPSHSPMHINRRGFLRPSLRVSSPFPECLELLEDTQEYLGIIEDAEEQGPFPRPSAQFPQTRPRFFPQQELG